MEKINIFKNINDFDFNYDNIRLDPVSKKILMESIQSQFVEFIEYIEIPLVNNNLDFLSEHEYNHYIQGIFSTNPLEHCLINHYVFPNNETEYLNKYHYSGLICYLIEIGFRIDLSFVKKSVNFYNSQITLEPDDYYLIKATSSIKN